MGYKITFKPLFQVNVWHDYLLNKGEDDFGDLPQKNQDIILEKYDINKFLEIAPTYDCMRLLKNYNMIFRKTRFGFMIALKVDEVPDGENSAYTPFIPWKSFFTLAFTLRIKDPNFQNVTNFSQSTLSNTIHHFTNINSDISRVYPSLSSPIPSFQPQRKYDPGALIKRAGKLYESLVEITGSSSFKPTQWKEIPSKAYFNPEDYVVLAKSFYTYEFTASNIRSANFILTKLDGTTVLKKRISSQKAIKDHALSLSDVKPGNYSLSITGTGSYEDTKKFYWDPQLIQEKPFALIEIAQIPSLQSNENQLFNPGSNNLLRKKEDVRTFEVNFKNRSTFWCYYFGEAQSGNFGDFVAVDSENTIFVNKKIRPLTQFPVEIKKFTEDTLLPNPSIKNIFPKRRSYPEPGEALKIYSEIFI